ncbi:MAG: hypothetical protein HPM95_19660 [Alphaproteobacteria bacterium]|nr:hypothetical protein [Alphaproteobacteria bacterium]
MEAQIGGIGARETAARAVAVSALKSAMDRVRRSRRSFPRSSPRFPPIRILHRCRRGGRGRSTRNALQAEFAAAARAMSAKLDAPADGDLVDSFWSNARSLVSIRQPGKATPTRLPPHSGGWRPVSMPAISPERSRPMTACGGGARRRQRLGRKRGHGSPPTAWWTR